MNETKFPLRSFPLLLLFLIALASCACQESSDAPHQYDAVEDHHPPVVEYTLTVLSPVDSAVVSQPAVLVTGVVEGATSGSVTVNGLTAQRDLPVFSLWYDLQEGENQLDIVYNPDLGPAVADSLTVYLDSVPPVLKILTPGRGTVVDDGTVVHFILKAFDESKLNELSVGGHPVQLPVADPDNIEVDVPAADGLNIITADTDDKLGNGSREHRTVLTGPFGTCEFQPDSEDLVIDLGNEALFAVGGVAAQLLEGLDIDSYIGTANPVYASDSIEVNLDSAELQSPSLVPAVHSGKLSADVQLGKITVTGTILLKSLNTTYLFTGTVTDLKAHLAASVQTQQSELQVEIQEIDVDAGKVQISVSDSEGNLVVAPSEVTGNFLEFITDMLSGILLDVATELSAAAMEYTSASFALTVYGKHLTLTYNLVSVQTMPDNLRVSFGAEVTIGTGDPLIAWPHGCPLRTTGPPPHSSALATPLKGATLWLSYDFLNRTLVRLWRTKLFHMEWGQSDFDEIKMEIDLVCGLLGSLLDFLPDEVHPETPMKVRVAPILPPVLAPIADELETGTEHPGVGLGAITLEHYEVPAPGQENRFATVMMAVRCSLAAQVKHNVLVLSPELKQFYMDIDDSFTEDQKRLVERDIEAYFETLVPQLLGSLKQALMEIPLPTFYGIEIESGRLLSSDSGHVGISGSVVF